MIYGVFGIIFYVRVTPLLSPLCNGNRNTKLSPNVNGEPNAKPKFPKQNLNPIMTEIWKGDGNLRKGAKLPSGLASMFVELAGANLAWG